MNIILDMDETLIHGNFEGVIIPRPYLFEFLQFVFERFKNVSIWTAANKAWFEIVNEKVFSPILEVLNCSFDKVLTEEHTTLSYVYDDFYGQSFMTRVKKLRKLHKSKKSPDYTIHNMIVVDDTKTTFQKNYGNAIHIQEFMGGRDKELKKLMRYLEEVLLPYFSKYGTIRTLEKRYWSTKNMV
jgi:hypothetical protein